MSKLIRIPRPSSIIFDRNPIASNAQRTAIERTFRVGAARPRHDVNETSRLRLGHPIETRREDQGCIAKPMPPRSAIMLLSTIARAFSRPAPRRDLAPWQPRTGARLESRIRFGLPL
jgi:hypothetical protein